MSLSKPVLILGDSRGLGLQEAINKTGPHVFRVRFVSSAGLTMAATTFLSEIITLKPAYVIISAGICEVTLKNNISKKYTVKSTEPEASVQSYKEAMSETKNLIQDVSPCTKVIFNPVTGVDLEDYNTKARSGLTGDYLKRYQDKKICQPMRNILNQTIIKINREIAAYNYENKVATPWSAGLVHKREGKDKYYHHYQYLSDGCHLLPEMLSHWATKFQYCISKSIEISTT